MSVERPTFHEAWHRVADSTPRLRSGVQIRRQRFRGRDWWIAEDPATNQFFRLNRSAYRFVGLLDGRRSVGDVWRACEDSLGDEAPTQGEAIALLGQLYGSNLLATAGTNLGGDAEAMLRRQSRRVTLETQGKLGSFLSLRIPLVDPDRALNTLAGLFGWMFSVWGLVIWLGLMGIGLTALAGRWDDLIAVTSQALAVENLPWLYAAFVFAKLVHECAHGVACKVFGKREGAGGEVHAMGIMLLVLLPAPYVDATSAWGLRSKWRRITVGAAGMLAELSLAAVAAVIWSRTAEGSVIGAISANVIFIAGISTVLFNANPLLRYDGYYMLSDWLEMPNLQQRSREFLKGLVKRHAWGITLKTPTPASASERTLLAVFGLASTAYLLAVTTAITFYVAEQWFFVGVLLAVVAASLWFIAPVGKLLRYLAIDPELDRTRPRALWTSLVTLLLAVALIGFVPAPRAMRVYGHAESGERKEARVGADGFVTEVLAPGTDVNAGTVLVVAENRAAESEARALRARLEGFESRWRQALAERPAEAPIEDERVKASLAQAERAEARMSSVALRASGPGIWAPDDAVLQIGAYLERGARVGQVVSAEGMRVRATVGQDEASQLLAAGEASAEVRIVGRPWETVACSVDRVVETGHKESVGATANETSSEGRTAEESPLERTFEVWLRPLDAEHARVLRVGQRIVARIELENEPLGAQCVRWARQTLQRRFGV